MLKRRLLLISLPEGIAKVPRRLPSHVTSDDSDIVAELIVSNRRLATCHFLPIFHPNITCHYSSLTKRHIAINVGFPRLIRTVHARRMIGSGHSDR